MGSGETSPTMVTAHQRLLADVPSSPGAALTLDSPYGFQENADELSERVLRYFADAVGRRIDVASLRSPDAAALVVGTTVEALRRARWVFAGPGSPTYALRVWRETGAASAFEAVLARGHVVFASAAALTAGAFTMPVYEIYKVGEDPHWLPGLDFLGHATGLRAAVIPHFDNAEGGTHDTRFCYVGERRLSALEAMLPEDCFVLGIDEHTGVRFDLDSQRVHVFGRGGMTVRMNGLMWVVPTGGEVSVQEVAERAGTRLTTSETSTPVVWDDLTLHSMLDEGRVEDAVDALLALDDVERDPAKRAAMHAVIIHLGQLAANPSLDLAEIVGPYIEALLAARSAARQNGFWAEADEIRTRLRDLRVTIADTPDGSTWSIA